MSKNKITLVPEGPPLPNPIADMPIYSQYKYGNHVFNTYMKPPTKTKLPIDVKLSKTLDSTTSSTRAIPAGLPQGSVLSPILYNIFIADFPPIKDVQSAFYADDTAIFASANRTKTICSRLQKAVNVIGDYFAKWKIKINSAKTQAIVFPFNNQRKRRPTSQIQLNNTAIEFSKEVKYLGVQLDEKLLFGAHINKIGAKASRCVSSIFPLISRSSKLYRGNKILLYKTVVRPMLVYASPVWPSAALSHRKKLQIIQNRCLKIICNLPRRFSTSRLHGLTGIPLMNEFLLSSQTKFIDNCANSSANLIRNLM